MGRHLSLLKPGVKYLILRVTGRCNAACAFCLNRYFESRPAPVSDELGVPEYERIARNLPGLVLLNLSGGEPYLREDLAGIAGAFIRRAGVRLVSSPTNGSFPERTAGVASRILAAHRGIALKVGISIDGSGEGHDRIRGLPDGYARALETARRLRDLKKRHSNLLIHAITTVSAANVRDLVPLMRELASLRLFDGHYFTLVRGKGPGSRLSKDEFALYREASARLLSEFNGPDVFKDAVLRAIFRAVATEVERSYLGRRNSFSCRAGERLVNITERGELCICEVLDRPSLGNLREYDYDPGRVLQSPAARERVGEIRAKGCDCHWECAISASLLFGGVKGYFKVLGRIAR